MDIFTHAMNDRMRTEAPLAARMRPRNLDEYIGQEHILGPGRNTLAMCIANQTKSDFITLSAVMAGKADLRAVIEKEAVYR